jgi:L-Lysine epsilon oxidase N-terminal/L-lysine epsilon oxidase C-terminal domain
MAKEYKIYPGIGISRLGDSLVSFFLSPEIPGLGPLELTADDSPKPVGKYKDANGFVRRQAARFRIFEFDTDSEGKTTSREIIAGNGTQIEWRVELANEKSAAGKFFSEDIPEDTAKLRNPDMGQSDLIIKPVFAPISGANQTVTASPDGKFRGQAVYLGELRTDAKGRLMVLGGRGVSGPRDLPIGGGSRIPGHPTNTFANNEGWHDDVADGPISATIHIPGQPDQVLTNAAWVIVAPPDYAPYTNGITTLYDVASFAAGITPPPTPSFQNDILPILKAAAGLRWVSSLDIWSEIPTDYSKLSSKSGENDQHRRETLALLLNNVKNTLANFHFTGNQLQVLNNWANGNFLSDFNPNPPTPPLTPDGIDRASLSQAVGGGFFPGIEAGIKMTSPDMYSAPFRITNKPFIFKSVPQSPHAGFVTRNMACPWQSDFFECENQSPTTVWWPAQRPIEVFVDAAAQTQKPWTDSIPTHLALVDKFSKLGFVKPLPGGGSEPLVEDERDGSVPHP